MIKVVEILHKRQGQVYSENVPMWFNRNGLYWRWRSQAWVVASVFWRDCDAMSPYGRNTSNKNSKTTFSDETGNYSLVL